MAPPSKIEELADTIKASGIQRAFGVTGSGLSLELITWLTARGIPYHKVAGEAAAALMAGGCSRFGKTAAVAISIKGPGVGNLFPGILSNYFEGRPALSISEAYGKMAPPHQIHKRLDHETVLFPLLSGYSRGSNASTVKKLIEAAEQEVPRPAHIDLTGGDEETLTVRPAGARRETATKELDEVWRRVERAQRPAVVLGSVAIRRLPHIRWETLEVPIVYTAAAKGSVDERGPFAGGVITGEIKELSPEQTILSHADLLIAVGLRHREVVRVKPFAAPLVSFDVVGEDEVEGFLPMHHIRTENLPDAVSTLLVTLKEKRWGADVVSRARNERRKAVGDGGTWNVGNAFLTLADRLAERAVLVLDTGLFATIGEMLWPAPTPAHFVGSSIGRFMGTAIPTAMGTALGTPNTEVVCVVGDGGIRTHLPELELAVSEKLPILFVLMSDGGYGSIANATRDKSFYHPAVELKNERWHEMVTLFGVPSAHIDSLKKLEETLGKWEKTDGPFFLELPFNPVNYRTATLKLR